MSTRFSVLASGSTGNAVVVGNERTKILIDAGLSAKKLELLLQERGVQGQELEAIFVTHEHSDHIKGLGVLAKRYGMPVYANAKTWEELDKKFADIPASQRKIIETGAKLDVGEFVIESFGISHDAVEPVGYCLYDQGLKLSVATDLGYVSPKVKEKLKDSDVLVIEANHDVEMLRVGHYPWNIKRRILGDTGHLSNDAAGEALTELLTGITRRVYLAHLSQDHNLLDLAKLSVNTILQEHGILSRQPRLQIMDTYPDRPTK
ncbi:MAG: metallohydrolase, partial [Paenibacillus sp. RIFOXYA1_FULL_44_5]